MNELTDFVGVKLSKELRDIISLTSEQQKRYKSNHKYDLAKFELTEQKIKTDCKNIYNTFLKIDWGNAIAAITSYWYTSGFIF